MIVHLTGEAQAAALKRHETNCQHRMETDEYNMTGTKPDTDSFDLFDLMLYAPFNNNGHVGTLPPFYVTYPTLGFHDTQNVLHKYNHPTKPIRLICMV